MKELPEETTEERIKIIQSRPPNFEKIAAVFHGAHGEDVIFAYGDAIYNPSGHKLPDELIAHEMAHCERQNEIGVDVWWDLYLTNSAFRYDEEYIAHLAELKHLISRAVKTSRGREAAIDHVARKLSAPLYEIKIPFHKAQAKLRRGLKNGR